MEAQRRPLKVRGSALVRRMAGWLSRRDITPNQISIASIVFAALAGCALLAGSPQSRPFSERLDAQPNAAWLLLAALFIQCRLLCNLFDGMVAVEGGKSTPAGELFNDLPDRIADPLILVAAGYAITSSTWGPTAGWLAALLAVITAYTRTLAQSSGAPADFRGPMAKQQRMALMTAACLLSMVEQAIWTGHCVLLLTLIVISVGCIITVVRRAAAACRYLEKQAGQHQQDQPPDLQRVQSDV